MDLTHSERSISIGDTMVTVRADSGPMAARWRVQVDGRDVTETQILKGDRTLRAILPDGSNVDVEVRQSALGPTAVTIRHEGVVVADYASFVA
jgi:hypothetical protein